MKQLVMLGIVVGLVACGQEDSTQPAAESNNWYDTDGSGGPGDPGGLAGGGRGA